MESATGDWVESLMVDAFDDPADRIVGIECGDFEVDGRLIGRVGITYTVEDHRGDTHEVRGKLYLPSLLRDDPTRRLPMIVGCGYEVTDELAPRLMGADRVVATTIQPPEGTLHLGEWVLLRGPNMEIVLSHLVRSLPFVDLTKIAYTGGSAGGYACLLAAAATFPASVVAAAVPPVNLAFMGAVARHNAALHSPGEDGIVTPAGMFAASLKLADDVWKQAYGEDPHAPAWIENSPIGHVDRVTCPAAVAVSTNDLLVPIDQFDRDLAEPMRTAKPGGLEMTGELVGPDIPAVQRRLIDELGDRAEVHVMAMPEGYDPIGEVDLTLSTGLPPLPIPDDPPPAGTWRITVVDEGELEFVISHFKYAYEPDFIPLIERCFERDVDLDQLTPAKLDQLLDRWRGVEWLSPGHPHLDRPAAERADVERGLVSYCGRSSDHVRRFSDLYGEVDDERRVLPDELLARLGATG